MKYLSLTSTKLLVMATCVVPFIGCDEFEELETSYGYRSGSFRAESVNGTSVLGGMFEAAGHDVRSRRYLSPKLAEADTIVWVPDSFTPPSLEVRKWLNDWLDEGGHTLIYVGRDYDAEQFYWEEVHPKMPANLKGEVKQRQKEAETIFQLLRTDVPEEADAEWFSIDGKAKPKDVKTLSGAWAEAIDVSKTKIKLNSRIELGDWGAETLLETEDGDLLVSRQWWEPSYAAESKLIVVANGSFLLNYPLINHEHRKLAGRLISEVPEDASVVFLEGADPQISDHEPEDEIPTGLEMFTVWPINWVLVHLGVIGVFFLLARWPIFGIASEIKEGSQSDFGLHVRAMAELLAQTKDRGFALARLHQFYQLTGKETVDEAKTAATAKQQPPSPQPEPPPPESPAGSSE